MEKQKTILLFSDLEGTILREGDSKIDLEAMYNFLSQIDKMQKLTGAKVNIHLVSPVFREQMEDVMYRMDKSIAIYNIEHKKSNILRVQAGAAYPDSLIGDEFLGDRIVPLKRPINSRDFDTARYGKSYYVRTWCDMYKDNAYDNLIMAIYCGNGRNDLDAMKYIKNRKDGFVVCPRNSRQQAKAIATFVSERTDLFGVSEGLENINKEIEKRVHPEKDVEDKKSTLPEGPEDL